MTQPIGPNKGRASGGQIAYLIEQVGESWHWRIYTALKTLAEGVATSYNDAEAQAGNAGPRRKEQ